MSAIYFLIPIAVGLVGFAIWLFVWAVDNGQYDDLDGPAHSILFDDHRGSGNISIHRGVDQNFAFAGDVPVDLQVRRENRSVGL